MPSKLITEFVRQCSEAELVAIGTEAALKSADLIHTDAELVAPERVLPICYNVLLAEKASAWHVKSSSNVTKHTSLTLAELDILFITFEYTDAEGDNVVGTTHLFDQTSDDDEIASHVTYIVECLYAGTNAEVKTIEK